MPIIRVFPCKTSYTPQDEYAFVGDPPLWRPEADEVHISCAFTWDIDKALRLQRAWQQYYPIVKVGGPAFDDKPNGFTPGRYIKDGVTFTSRGCNGHCPWCLVPQREGPLQVTEEIPTGYIVQDNNFLACPEKHRRKVYAMLSKQSKAAIFTGGLQASLVTDAIAEELRSVRIASVFLAADTDAHLPTLRRAVQRLAFLGRKRLRCYVLCGYEDESLQQAEARLEAVWETGAMPFAQLYRPADRQIYYTRGWRDLAKRWSRPAAMVAMHKGGR